MSRLGATTGRRERITVGELAARACERKRSSVVCVARRRTGAERPALALPWWSGGAVRGRAARDVVCRAASAGGSGAAGRWPPGGRGVLPSRRVPSPVGSRVGGRGRVASARRGDGAVAVGRAARRGAAVASRYDASGRSS